MQLSEEREATCACACGADVDTEEHRAGAAARGDRAVGRSHLDGGGGVALVGWIDKSICARHRFRSII